ncbi:hypothetical protein P7C70_g3095, partial [Phenoliferia sp. Uapishka_3]
MSMPHADIKGKFSTIARLVAVEGKEQELKALLAAVRHHSEGATEPLCLTYRTLQGAGSDVGVFTVFEEYAEREALVQHRTSEPYLALKNAGLIKEMSVNFFEEFQ